MAKRKGVEVDPVTGERSLVGVMGSFERAYRILGTEGSEASAQRVLDHCFSDLMQLAAGIQQYALGRDLVQLRERIERLEKLSKPKRHAKRSARRVA